MKTIVTKEMFIRDFLDIRPNNFSYEALEVFFDYIEEYEQTTDTEVVFDVIGFCCEFTEYENFEEYKNEYQNEDIKTLDDLEEYTQVIRVNKDKFIIANY
tara:strand:- start:98 stop:397 length:300 start_codon:yes stop_codon:yes gene_type:complete